jgi:hypothetical protein
MPERESPVVSAEYNIKYKQPKSYTADGHPAETRAQDYQNSRTPRDMRTIVVSEKVLGEAIHSLKARLDDNLWRAKRHLE